MKTAEATKTKKITLATFKAFIRKNQGHLWIRNHMNFDGMYDCVMPCGDRSFRPVTSPSNPHDADLGIAGVWMVGGSRNCFEAFNGDGFTGIRVDNCCGSFTLAVQK